MPQNIKETIQKEIEKIWPQAKKNISKASRDAVKLMKESEKNLIEIYGQIKKKTERLVFKAKREELYYELGKKIAPLLTPEQLNNKEILRIHAEIRQAGKKIRAKR